MVKVRHSKVVMHFVEFDFSSPFYFANFKCPSLAGRAQTNGLGTLVGFPCDLTSLSRPSNEAQIVRTARRDSARHICQDPPIHKNHSGSIRPSHSAVTPSSSTNTLGRHLPYRPPQSGLFSASFLNKRHPSASELTFLEGIPITYGCLPLLDLKQ